jgi:hypothetical protein
LATIAEGFEILRTRSEHAASFISWLPSIATAVWPPNPPDQIRILVKPEFSGPKVEEERAGASIPSGPLIPVPSSTA